MKNLPANLILEKNKLASTGAWLLLLDVNLPDTSVLRLARNTDNVTFGGNTYTAFPFEIEASNEGSQGEIPTVTLRLSNVTRNLQGYLEAQGGAVGASVVLTVVSSLYLAENYSELQLTYDVLAATADAQWVVFTLGAAFPQRRRFPLLRAIAHHCAWTYKGRECNYGGGLTACKRTLADCQAHANAARFGGRPGLSGNVRLA